MSPRRVQSFNEFKLTARRVLELGTIEGARSMGVDDKVGSLKPGKRADITTVTTPALNMGGFADPAHLLVGAALPENVDTVIDGRILKRDGKLTALSAPQVVADARAALEGYASARIGDEVEGVRGRGRMRWRGSARCRSHTLLSFSSGTFRRVALARGE
jgi:hypothetical protein